MNYAIEMGWAAMISTPSYTNLGAGIKMLWGGGSEPHREDGVLVDVILLKKKENRLNI
jgi:hypothetical protein